MQERVVVLGAGYAGLGRYLNSKHGSPPTLNSSGSRTPTTTCAPRGPPHHPGPRCQGEDHHPVEDIKSHSTEFIHNKVTNVDVDARDVELESGDVMDYDYLVVAIGTDTADFGIPGIQEHAHTLKSLADALGIHDAVTEAAQKATREDPA